MAKGGRYEREKKRYECKEKGRCEKLEKEKDIKVRRGENEGMRVSGKDQVTKI